MHRLSYDWRTRVAHGSLPKRLPEFLRFMKKLDLHTYFRGALHPTGPKFWSFGISDQPIPRRSTFCSDKFYMCIRAEKCKAFTVHAAVALGQRARLHFCKDHKVTSQERSRGRADGLRATPPSLQEAKTDFILGFWIKTVVQIKIVVLVYNCGINNFQNVSKNSPKCIQKPSKYQNVSKMSPKCLQKLSKTKMSPKTIQLFPKNYPKSVLNPKCI